MKDLIAVCGLICNKCPAYIASQRNDEEEKKRIARLWSSGNDKLTADDITCYGCLTIGKPKTKFCSICKVRQCGIEKNIKNCAYCEEYPCEILEKLLIHIRSPEAKVTLDNIRRKNL